ncbi:MAG TPA: hypothetical protein VNS50_12050, partial [Ginsengibacter sp.]|nr:hypothetical protein [Ginsengibacter sp.]
AYVLYFFHKDILLKKITIIHKYLSLKVTLRKQFQVEFYHQFKSLGLYVPSKHTFRYVLLA